MKKTLTTNFNRSVTVEAKEGAVFLSVENTSAGNTVHTRLDHTETAVLQEFLSDALEPQKFYLKLFDNEEGFVNKGCVVGHSQHITASKHATSTWQTQFTQEEIDSDPALKKFEAFKVPVPAEEATD